MRKTGGGSDAVTVAIGAVVVCQSPFTPQLKAPQIRFSYRRHRSDDFKPVSTEKKVS